MEGVVEGRFMASKAPGRQPLGRDEQDELPSVTKSVTQSHQANKK